MERHFPFFAERNKKPFLRTEPRVLDAAPVGLPVA